MPQQSTVQPLTRGLRILEVINDRPGSSTGEIAQACDLSHSTTHRILVALTQNGFVRRDEGTRRYLPTSRVLRLVGGFDTLAYVTERALGVVDGLAREWEWPIDFSTRDHLCMRISVSTDLQNPLSVHKLQPGTRIPLLQCGAGLACLARQADPVRSKLIEAAIKEPGDVVWDRRGLEQVLLKSSQEGFALFRRPQRFTAMVALSVPIVVNGEANAALSVRFAERALPVAKAVERYLPRLASAASRLSDDPCSDARANAVARVY